jgi:hypothetical protein
VNAAKAAAPSMFPRFAKAASARARRAGSEARKAGRSSESKRKHFQLLYELGRLCGLRAATIRALQNGEVTSEELAQRAFAHLAWCRHCRSKYNTNAKKLRLTDDQ